MEFGYKNIAVAPTTAPPATTWTCQEQPDLQRGATDTTSSGAGSTSSTPLIAKKRVLKARKSCEAMRPTQRCLVSDFDDIDMAEQP